MLLACIILACALISTLASPAVAQTQPTAIVGLLREFRPIGGGGNNRINPNMDPVPGSPELTLTQLNFAPHTNDGLVNGPSPRSISNVISGGTDSNGGYSETTDPIASGWLYVMGQFVDHDLSLEETPQTNPQINITIPIGDPTYPSGGSIALTRATRSPWTNTIVNTAAGYLDLSQLYGSTPARAAALTNPDGSLTSSAAVVSSSNDPEAANEQYLPIVSDTFVTGDPRVAENPELTAVTTLFLREHNYWVGVLKEQHPAWSPNTLYNMAKAITTAEYQNIIYTEFLPSEVGPVVGPYRGYNPSLNAQVTQEFSTAAFRLHTQVSDTEEGLNSVGTVVFSESLATAFFNTPETDEANGVDSLLRGIGVDNAQATDPYTVSVLRNLLVAALVGGDVDLIDLMAIDIQRERDAGLGTLNQTRLSMGLRPYTSFAFISDPLRRSYYQTIFGNVNNVDLFMGGLAESHAPGAIVGPTFQAIIADQFYRLRVGDRFWWQNEGFDAHTAATISGTTLADIIERNAPITNEQPNVFIESPYPVSPSTAPHVKRHAAHPLRLPKGLKIKPLI